MNTRTRRNKILWLLAALLAWPITGAAQVPVDEQGNPVGEFEGGSVVATEELPTLSAAELDELVGPIALYPDDLLAIILPASTYPLQIVQAARFLEELDDDGSLEPNGDWDDSVVALTNYPEVVEMMSEDLDWTWRLGEAVVAQQTDVIQAIESFRDRAYAAGNLKSDDFQNVSNEDGVIHITPVEEDVIYVPYYEPERVVVYQPRPVYYYYPRPYPVYYYPYPVGYSFNYPYFWGVTTAYAIGWHTHHLRVWHHSYHGHPYYGHTYWRDWWYRRPAIHVHNNYYVNNYRYSNYDRYRRGDYWQPNSRRTVRLSDQRITRTRYFPSPSNRTRVDSTATVRNYGDRVTRSAGSVRQSTSRRATETRPPITFRERTGTATSRSNSTVRPSTMRTETRSREPAERRTTTQRSQSQATLRSSTQRPQSTARQSTQRRQTQPSLRSSSQRSQSQPVVRSPVQSRDRATAPARQSATRSTSQRSANVASLSRPSQPRPSFSAPSQNRQSASRPSQSRQSTSRPSQSRQSNSQPTRSSSSQSRPSSSSSESKSKSKSGSNSRSASVSRNSSRRH